MDLQIIRFLELIYTWMIPIFLKKNNRIMGASAIYHRIHNFLILRFPTASLKKISIHGCVKSVQIRSFFWSVVFGFGMNTEIYP